MDIWNNTTLEEMRRERRERSGRITFDCYSLRAKGDRVYCTKGHLLGHSRDGTSDLLRILKGFLLGVCKDCKDYDGDD